MLIGRAASACFNPRAHAGRDPIFPGFFTGIKCFNPRAHAGRDDVTGPNGIIITGGFNPRAHAGRDSVWIHVYVIRLVFQSTRPRGARLKR